VEKLDLIFASVSVNNGPFAEAVKKVEGRSPLK
jgi:hypothetical protein